MLIGLLVPHLVMELVVDVVGEGAPIARATDAVCQRDAADADLAEAGAVPSAKGGRQRPPDPLICCILENVYKQYKIYLTFNVF
jgi:hypothetical protein